MLQYTDVVKAYVALFDEVGSKFECFRGSYLLVRRKWLMKCRWGASLGFKLLTGDEVESCCFC